MPIFDYKCEQCGLSSELIVGFGDSDRVWHNCLNGRNTDCELVKSIGATRTTFKHADKSGNKVARK